jgi:hypothetical protein
MNTQLLNDKNFLKKDQFQKREIFKKYILTNKNCKIGTKIICFEKETLSNIKYFYNKINNHKQVHYITIGKEYQILDHKEGKVKILNDANKKCWCAIGRFLYSIQLERKEKLKKLQNII